MVASPLCLVARGKQRYPPLTPNAKGGYQDEGSYSPAAVAANPITVWGNTNRWQLFLAPQTSPRMLWGS